MLSLTTNFDSFPHNVKDAGESMLCLFRQSSDSMTYCLSPEILHLSTEHKKICSILVYNLYKKALNSCSLVNNGNNVRLQFRFPSIVDRLLPLFRWKQSLATFNDNECEIMKANCRSYNHIAPTSEMRRLSLSRITSLSFVAETKLPTFSGTRIVRAYRDRISGMEPIAIIEGRVCGMYDVPIRVHDQCFTSEVLGSMKCECREQLDYSLEYIKNRSFGIVIYLQQEGRGIGLANKIKAYSMQEKGFDTVDANRVLGFKSDYRQYDIVADILHEIGVQTVRIMTNNPRKLHVLRKSGVVISGRIPIVVGKSEYNSEYLRIKAQRMGHIYTV